MDSFILIDSVTAWVILIYLVLQFLVFILIGNGYLKSRQEIDLKDKQLKKLRSRYNILIGEYHRATFKVPQVKDDG